MGQRSSPSLWGVVDLNAPVDLPILRRRIGDTGLTLAITHRDQTTRLDAILDEITFNSGRSFLRQDLIGRIATAIISMAFDADPQGWMIFQLFEDLVQGGIRFGKDIGTSGRKVDSPNDVDRWRRRCRFFFDHGGWGE